MMRYRLCLPKKSVKVCDITGHCKHGIGPQTNCSFLYLIESVHRNLSKNEGKINIDQSFDFHVTCQMNGNEDLCLNFSHEKGLSGSGGESI